MKWKIRKSTSNNACSTIQIMMHPIVICYFYHFLSFFPFPLHESTTTKLQITKGTLGPPVSSANHRMVRMLLIKDMIFSSESYFEKKLKIGGIRDGTFALTLNEVTK